MNASAVAVPSVLETFPLGDTSLEAIRVKVLAGIRLSFEDGVALYRTNDLLGLGRLANHVREARHGDIAYFVCNTHINHTNVCAATCDFCAFAAKTGEVDSGVPMGGSVFDVRGCGAAVDGGFFSMGRCAALSGRWG